MCNETNPKAKSSTRHSEDNASSLPPAIIGESIESLQSGKKETNNNGSNTTNNTPPAPLEEKDEQDQQLIRLALHKSPFFTCLDEEQVQQFIKVAELRSYRGGQSIILEGCVDDVEVEVDQLALESSSRELQQSTEKFEEEGEEAIYQQVNNARFEAKNSGTSDLQEQALSANERNPLFPAEDEGFVFVENTENHDGEATAETHAEGETIEETVELSSSANDIDEEKNQPIHASTQQTVAKSSMEATSVQDDNTKDLPFTSRAAAPPTSEKDDPTSKHYLEPPPPRSGVPSCIYIIRTGQADVMYSRNVNPASLGKGTVFGEGGFLFGRQHSASVVAASGVLECYVVDATTFRNYVLPSENMTKLYNTHATHADEQTNSKYMTMQDFVNSCLEDHASDESQQGSDDHSNHINNGKKGNVISVENADGLIKDPLAGVRIANTFNILRNDKPLGTTMSQRISLADFCLFHLLMARPDPEVDITFLLIDEHKRGVLYKEDIAKFLKSTFDDFVFDMDSEFIHRHFGKDDAHQRGIRPNQFSQFLVDLRREIGLQVFLQELERKGTPEGYLPPSNFVKVLKTACGWRLPEGVADRLERIYRADQGETGTDASNETVSKEVALLDSRQSTPFPLDSEENQSRRLGDHYFTYCDFLAFQEVLGQLPGICNLIDRACEIKKGPVSADDFKVANRVLGMGGNLSRRQVEIIFALFDLDRDGYVSHEDTVAVAGVEVAQRIDAVAGRRGTLTFAPPPKFRHGGQVEHRKTEKLAVLLQNFSLTSIAGAIGVVALAPLDLVKTRLMNERIEINGNRMYKNSFDCLRLALRSEGYLGLYRGLLPQLIGVAPEKAIKLAVNDLLIQSMGTHGSEKSGLRYAQEMLAGGCAGACQLLITNPIEIVKIRMQLQGETARLLKARGYHNPVPQSLKSVVRTLGYSGLFTGARACLLRDIPFGAIYFPTYAFLKENLSSREGQTSASNLLVAGTVAGIPASFLTTPADVIKTRLQVVPRPGEVRYDGIRDCFTRVYQREGPTAFFRGSAMRVAKLSPQFGISLVAYEQLSVLLGATGLMPPTTVPVHPKDYWEAFPERAINQKADDTDRLLKNLGSKSLRPGGPWTD